MLIQTTVQDIIDNLDHMQLYVPIEMKETLALASAMLVRCECAATTPAARTVKEDEKESTDAR